MLVYMLKDLEKVGIAGQLVKVKSGHAKNFLIPRGYAKEVKESEEKFFKSRSKAFTVKKEAIESKTSILSEKIKNLNVSIKKKIHDDGKLYGSVGSDEIVDALKAKDISINKKQVEFTKSIRTTGEHTVVIKLSAKLKPELSVKVVPESD